MRSDGDRTLRSRTYGRGTPWIVVVHGGPGAGGEMAPVAEGLAAVGAVLEPLQTATTLDGQVAELHRTIRDAAAAPVVLIGFSWGAWLSVLVALRHPEVVRKLILIGSGPYEVRYVEEMNRTRMARLASDQQEAWNACLKTLRSDAPDEEKRRAHERLGTLAETTDTYERGAPDAPPEATLGSAMNSSFHGLLTEASAMRESGELLRAAGGIRCPVVAIHGDYDPHPLAGVAEPLASAVKDFTMIELERCGHTPWIERHARSAFFEILKREVAGGSSVRPTQPAPPG